MKYKIKPKQTLTITISGKTAAGKSTLRDILRLGLGELGWPRWTYPDEPHKLYTIIPITKTVKPSKTK